jgi:endogenous inhibitor of DNA gyrase (YacG/DUF329 family)
MNQCKWCGNSYGYSQYHPLCSKKCRYESDLQEANKETKPVSPLKHFFNMIILIVLILWLLMILLI